MRPHFAKIIKYFNMTMCKNNRYVKMVDFIKAIRALKYLYYV